jgi:hypothetical protein
VTRAAALAGGFVVLALAGITACGGRRETPPANSAPPDAAETRIVLFGIDGADWDRAIPLVRMGKLPTLARVMREGTSRTLRSLEPERLSPTIWTTAATGVLPDKHGIDNFVARGPDGSLRPITSNQRRRAALWNIFSSRGISVGVLGWLATWPAEPVHGWLVSSYTPFVFDWGAASSARCRRVPAKMRASPWRECDGRERRTRRICGYGAGSRRILRPGRDRVWSCSTSDRPTW